ncbi:MAG TPA: SDR family oxidoreductase [Aquabacterium sp.]|nr:SDR family oxidoreductase [Aquabacterium sp.]HQC97028.1 SDR family oxidoreductase [Aquabacterium sp.]
MTAAATTPHNRVALVTGAGSGIGLGCATALVADGWRVVYTGRRAEALQAAIAKAGDPWGDIAERTLAVPCDVGDETSVDALFAAIGARFGRLDLLFNNAGVSLPVLTPDEMDAATWRRAVDTNLNGAFFCLSGAFKMMRHQVPMGGRIINNGSISAYAPRPGSIAYTATKHAVSGLTRAAALDGRAFDIAVGQIDIGNVASDMTERMTKGVPQADGSIKPEARMDLQSVVDAFMTMARMPASANMLFVNVMATKMPFVGRG